MKRKRRGSKSLGKGQRKVKGGASDASLSLYSEFTHLKNHIEKLWEIAERQEDRLEDIEIHVNLLTRLLTTLCVEKLGMRIGVLKRLIKRIEKEAIRDSQIFHLESLYNLPVHPEKKSPASPHTPKRDPWEDIS